MFYLKWTEKDIKGLNVDGLSCVYTEVDEKGRVTKEIGVDVKGKIVHKWPGADSKFGIYGLFDLAPIDTSKETASTGTEFSKSWGKNLGDIID
jgi:hypothetical protein